MLNQVEFARELAKQKLLKQGFSEHSLESVKYKVALNKPADEWNFSAFYIGTRPLCAENLELFSILAATNYLRDAPQDRNFRDLSYKISIFLAESDIQVGLRQREAQRQRAKHTRDKLADDGLTLGGIIDRLVKTHPDERPKEMWQHFIGRLDAAGLEPTEHTCGTDGLDLQVRYHPSKRNGKPKTLTLRRFGALVSKARKKIAR